jgi:hypothetical protein
MTASNCMGHGHRFLQMKRGLDRGLDIGHQVRCNFENLQRRVNNPPSRLVQSFVVLAGWTLWSIPNVEICRAEEF